MTFMENELQASADLMSGGERCFLGLCTSEGCWMAHLEKRGSLYTHSVLTVLTQSLQLRVSNHIMEQRKHHPFTLIYEKTMVQQGM